MGSSFFGEPKMKSEKSGGTTTRKSKKSGSSDKPKQPQRGLGVAQLEKIRLHSQMGGCTSFHPSQNQLHSPSYAPSSFITQELRTQGGYSSSSFSYASSTSSSMASYGFNPNYMVGIADYERANIRYTDSQTSNPTSWPNATGFLEIPPYVQPSMTRHFLNMHVEDSQPEKSALYRSRLLGSSSPSSDSNDATQEPDLELRLSL